MRQTACDLADRLDCRFLTNIIAPNAAWKQSLEELIEVTRRMREPEQTTRLCWLVEGVREVINAVKIGPARNVADYSYDNLIESQIEARLVATKNIKSINYTAEVVEGTAYLIGLAQNDEERKRVEKVASYTKGVKSVESYIRLRNDRRPFPVD